MIKIFLTLIFLITFASYSAVFGFSGSSGQGCGSCSAPIEVNARKVFDLLSKDNPDELTQKLSDPLLCESIECSGLSIEEAHNTIKNILEQRRFQKSQDLTMYATIFTTMISLVALLLSYLGYRFTKTNSKIRTRK